MTLTLDTVVHGDICHGWTWTIKDENELATQVAQIALGQYKHVSRILDGLTSRPMSTTADHAADAIKKLTVAPGAEAWHRDGWIFQAISWIAAHQKKEAGFLRGPHIRKADHGFDGLQLEFSPDGKSVTAVIIFEDKATTNPRPTIRDDVWPSIADLEAGQRVTELTSDVTGMLEAYRSLSPEVDVEQAVSEILWKEARRYRVSITIGDAHASEQKRADLFAGYDENAPGAISKRRAETIYIPELRKWMDGFAARVIDKVKELAANV